MSKDTKMQKISYFDEEELQEIESKFLNFKELLEYSYTLFTRVWWKALLKPFLWLAFCIAWIIGLGYGGYYVAKSSFEYASSMNSPLMFFVFGIIAFILYMTYVVVAFRVWVSTSIRANLLIDDARATFWKVKDDVWKIFWSRTFLSFLILPFTILVLIIFRFAHIDIEEGYLFRILSIFPGVIFSITIFLVTFKDFAISQALIASYKIITKNPKAFIIRSFEVSLFIGAPFALFTGLAYYATQFPTQNFLILGLQFFTVVISILWMILVLLLAYPLLYTSFVNLHSFSKIKEPSHYKFSLKHEIWYNIVVIILIMGLIVEFVTLAYLPLIENGYPLSSVSEISKPSKVTPYLTFSNEPRDLFVLSETASDGMVNIRINKFYTDTAQNTDPHCVIEGNFQNLGEEFLTGINEYAMYEDDKRIPEIFGIKDYSLSLIGSFETDQSKDFVLAYPCDLQANHNYIWQYGNNYNGNKPLRFNLLLKK